MDRGSHEAIVQQRVDSQLESIFPDGEGTASSQHVRIIVQHVAKIAFEAGRLYALDSLMTTEDMAHVLGVSQRRVNAIAQLEHQRWGTGRQVMGNNPWLFTPEEIESMRPGPVGHPRK